MVEQIKKAFTSVKEYWAQLAPARKKLFAIITGVVLAFAVGVTVILNFSNGSYVLLYENMANAESIEVYNALQGMSIPARMTNGEVEVPRESKEYAKAQLAMQNIPKTTLSYDIFNGGGGLTTTDFEKRQLLVQQLQNRLQDTIRQYDGIKNAYVTLSIAQESNRVWETSSPRSTGSVSIVLEPGYTLSRDQVSGIKFLVASSVGSTMTVGDVKVIDAATSISLKSREDSDMSNADIGLERLGFEDRIESRLVEKALNVLTIAYAPEDIRVSATVALDYNKMLTESKQYSPSTDSKNNSGILSHEDQSHVSDGSSIVGGVVGEENNTDTPVYVDQDKDGTIDYINSTSSRDYAVSYITQQIEKDQAELISASLAITIKGEVDDLTKSSIIENVSKATNIQEANISVQNFMVDGGQVATEAKPSSSLLDDPMIIIIIAALGVLLLIILIVIVILSGRSKKRRKAAESSSKAPEPIGLDLQRDLEARKRMLLEGAELSKQENAITDEMKNFARENPEITANILRTWLKEDED
ncbi:MAG TPA: flagellar basal-body MS-ring/collar protein FliF [Clostridia bacterium]|nr:flagellar basal-body MS-ring/collar protein FliF [Clostridia bacterium]